MEFSFHTGLRASFLIDLQTGKRSPSTSDYKFLVQLCHDLPNQDRIEHPMVTPEDVSSKYARWQMLQAGILHPENAYLGSAAGYLGAKSTIEMAQILFCGGLDRVVTLGLISPISPLGYSPEMIDA